MVEGNYEAIPLSCEIFIFSLVCGDPARPSELWGQNRVTLDTSLGLAANESSTVAAARGAGGWVETVPPGGVTASVNSGG